MTNIVNLNKARKARKRAEKDTKAEENRQRFGRTKAQKAADEAAKAWLKSSVDQAKLD